MILILIALVVGLVASIALMVYSDGDYEGHKFFAGFSGMVLAFALAISCMVYAFVGWNYISASYKADIINREYKTNYTQAEIFWAGDVIDTIKQIERQRIELNGDLLREKK